jgi:hypothetical protein
MCTGDIRAPSRAEFNYRPDESIENSCHDCTVLRGCDIHQYLSHLRGPTIRPPRAWKGIDPPFRTTIQFIYPRDAGVVCIGRRNNKVERLCGTHRISYCDSFVWSSYRFPFEMRMEGFMWCVWSVLSICKSYRGDIF